MRITTVLKAKERIIEALAVRKLKEKPKGPILMFGWPSGSWQNFIRPFHSSRT